MLRLNIICEGDTRSNYGCKAQIEDKELHYQIYAVVIREIVYYVMQKYKGKIRYNAIKATKQQFQGSDTLEYTIGKYYKDLRSSILDEITAALIYI